MQGKFCTAKGERNMIVYDLVYGLLCVCHSNDFSRFHVRYWPHKCVQQNEQNG